MVVWVVCEPGCFRYIAEANSTVLPKHASADTIIEWIPVPRDTVANFAVVLRSYASVHSVPPPAAQHGRPNAPSVFLPASAQVKRFLTIFLNHFTPVKGIRSYIYQHLHIIKNSPGHIFAKSMCTDDADDDMSMACNPDEEFDHQILPDILAAAGGQIGLL